MNVALRDISEYTRLHKIGRLNVQDLFCKREAFGFWSTPSLIYTVNNAFDTKFCTSIGHAFEHYWGYGGR